MALKDIVERVGAEESAADAPVTVPTSLQVNARPSGSAERLALQRSWPKLLKRAKELGYNRKLDSYVFAERKLCELAEKYAGTPREIRPIEMEIVAVKPEWLCGTFAFHPMLGFRRKRQAQSIAHGCASTLLRFANISEAWLTGRGIAMAHVPRVKQWGGAFAALGARGRDTVGNECWVRPGVICPFSEDALEKAQAQLTKIAIKELNDIHRECPKLETQLKQL